jgi:fluoride exporter
MHDNTAGVRVPQIAIYPGAMSATRQQLSATGQHQRSGPGAADLAAIAVGGGIGSVARYLLSAALPGHGFPWAIFTVNVSGCFCLGVLMIYLLEVWPPRRFLRPFLAIGLIGGYTTFSTYAGGVLTLLTSRAFALADAYALSSIGAALVAVWCGMRAARAAASLPARVRTRHSGGGS